MREHWIRKAGQGAYETILTPNTLRAIEKDVILDYADLRGCGRYYPAIDSIVIEDPAGKTSLTVSLDTLADCNFDLQHALVKPKSPRPSE